MLSDRLETSERAEPTAAELSELEYLRSWMRVSGVALALAGYIAATAYILSSNTSRIYGFPVSHDLRSLIEIALQVCPMIAALFLLPLSRLRDRASEAVTRRLVAAYPRLNHAVSKTLAVLAVAIATGFVVAVATAAALAGVDGFQESGVSALTIFWVSGELAFDLTLVAVLVAFLYALTRRVWITGLIFAAYVAAVVIAGPRLGITSYIGFGSTVPVLLTAYSTAPLYDGATWMLRGYWSCVALLMLSVLYAFDAPGEPLLRRLTAGGRPPAAGRSRLAAVGVMFFCSILVLAGLVRLQHDDKSRRETPSQADLDRALGASRTTGRLKMTHLSLRITYTPLAGVFIDGSLALRNHDGPARAAYFQLPAVLTVHDIRLDGAGKYSLRQLGTYLQATFAKPIPKEGEVLISYKGSIRSSGPFDLAVHGKVLNSAFFLSDADLLIMPRSAACVGASGTEGRCGAGENYLMSDFVTGRLAIAAPSGLDVVTSGEAAITPLGNGMSQHVFAFSTPRLANFIIGCARFRESEAVSNDGVRVRVFRSALGSPGVGEEAAMASKILSYDQGLWPAYSRRDLNIIEAPTPLGEAMAYDGAIAISDKIMTARNPVSGSPSHLLEFVIAHEVAHQWWGYRVVPERAPGRAFLMESVAQFAAYKYLGIRGILKESDAAEHELRRYRRFKGGVRTEIPLTKADAVDQLAYNKGPFVLLSLDRLYGGTLMTHLAAFIRSHSYDVHGTANAEDLAASLVRELPETSRLIAANLLYGTGEQRVADTSSAHLAAAN